MPHHPRDHPTARRQPRRDRPPGLRDLPPPRHRDRGGALRRRRRPALRARGRHRRRLPGNTPAETYLRADLVLEAAPRTGADAIHPGYGFLSENADFARAVIDAGLTWVGPAAGVHRVDGLQDRGQEADGRPPASRCSRNLTADDATEADLPLLVKASAGGGGRGHARRPRAWPTCPPRSRRRPPRRRRRSATAPSSSSRTSSTAATSRCRSSAHRGGVLVLGERDCSIQRRHQKVVEESPAPRPLRRHPQRAARRGRRGRRGRRLPRRRHRRVPLRPRDGALLLPGDEHPAPGRAPGHRAGARRRPGRAAADGRRGPRPRPAARSAPTTATPSRSGCTPRTRPPTGSRRAACSRCSTFPGVAGSSTCSTAPASGWTPASSPATRSRRTTTRCWPR